MIDGPGRMGRTPPAGCNGNHAGEISLRLKSIPRLGGSVPEIKGDFGLEVRLKLIRKIAASESYEGSRFYNPAIVLEISGTIKGEEDIMRQLLDAGGRKLRVCFVTPDNPTLWRGLAMRPHKMDNSGIQFMFERFVAERPGYHLIVTSSDRSGLNDDPFVIFETFDLSMLESR